MGLPGLPVRTVVALDEITFPTGESLRGEAWQRRHRGILVLLAAHAAGLPIFGLAMGARPVHAIWEGALIALLALAAWAPRLPRRTRSILASIGLMSSSAVLTHLSGGYIEAHFHFFVMLGVIFLYEDWLPYVLAVAYVTIHHGIVGTLDPGSVFNHPGAIEAPWLWASIHALFIFGLSSALVVAWNVIDRSRQAEQSAMDEAKGLRRQLHAQEKMAALGSLVAGIAHEVRTPLTIVTTNASLLERQTERAGLPPEAAARMAGHVREIQSSVERMNQLVLQLRRFHRLGDTERAPTRLEPLVQEAVDLFLAANRSAPRVRVELGATRAAELNALGVQQVVLNLLANAADAVDPLSGRIVVRTTEVDGAPALVVQDNGVGIPPEVAPRLFDPLFTTKREGMGLGLSIVRRIVEDHGGRIEFDSEPGKGTSFRVTFGAPRAPAPLLAATADVGAFGGIPSH